MFDTIVDSGVVRALFRLYFIGCLAIISLVGDRLFKLVARRRILKENSVNLAHMTGWLKGVDALTVIVQLRTLPGGAVLGSIMLLCALIALATDLSVAVLVTKDFVLKRCEFVSGMVVDTHTSFTALPSQDTPALVATNAQIISLENGGHMAIYRKVNENPNFRAEAADVLDWWKCVQNGPNTTYPYDTYDITQVLDDLMKNGQQTDDGIGLSRLLVEDKYEEQFVFWSVDAQTSPWSMLISVDTQDGGPDGTPVASYRCSLQTAMFAGMLRELSWNDTISLWKDTMRGSLYNGTNTPLQWDAEAFMELTLNTLVMVAGSNDSLLHRPPLFDQEQGCLVIETKVSSGVVILAGLVMFILAAVILCALWLGISNRLMARHSQTHLENEVPSGIIDWLKYAAMRGTDVERSPTHSTSKTAHLQKHRFRFFAWPQHGLVHSMHQHRPVHSMHQHGPVNPMPKPNTPDSHEDETKQSDQIHVGVHQVSE